MAALSEAKTLVYVNIGSSSTMWKSSCNNNLSIALMMAKQAIGLLYLTYYEQKGFEGGKRVILSANNKHELEEGMETFLADGTINCGAASSSLYLSVDYSFLSILKKRIPVFLDLYAMDSEIKLKVIKLFESLYYLCNEIHSIERILKISAFLQVVFLENSDESFQAASKRIKDMLNIHRKSINLFGRTGKLNSILNDIYDTIRNRYSHGVVDLYNEYNVVEATDYFIAYQVYMNILLAMAYEIDYSTILTTDDLINKIKNYRP